MPRTLPNSYPIIYVCGAIIAVLIIAMSSFFLVKAIKRGKAIGMETSKIKKVVTSSAIFSIVPSIPIVIGVGIMMSFLGLAIPWIRLTVIGALQYELIAMDQVVINGVPLTQQAIITDGMIATAFVIMTISILSGPLINLFFYKKYQTKLDSLQKNNPKLLDTITGALMGGLLAGLASYIIVAAFFTGNGTAVDNPLIAPTNGYITLITLAISAVIMAICGLFIKVFKWGWLENFALPITILGSMACAYGLTFAF